MEITKSWPIILFIFLLALPEHAVAQIKLRSTSSSERKQFVKATSRPANPQKEPAYAKCRFISDMDGILWLQDESHELYANTPLILDVPKSFRYSFMDRDTFFISNEENKKIIPAYRGKIIEIPLLFNEAYLKLFYQNEKEIIWKRFYDTINRHMVQLKIDPEDETDSGFEMAKFETTVAEFAYFRKQVPLDAGASSLINSYILNPGGIDERIYQTNLDFQFRPDGIPRNKDEDNHPVLFVTWEEATSYCKWLSDKDNYFNYRLPTNQEWTFAATCGGYDFIYPWDPTDHNPEIHANFADFSLLKLFPYKKMEDVQFSDGYEMTSPVGSFKPNCFGIHDLGGNVAEWLEDADITHKPTWRLIQGGSYFSPLSMLLIKNTASTDPKIRHSGIGFRIVRIRK